MRVRYSDNQKRTICTLRVHGWKDCDLWICDPRFWGAPLPRVVTMCDQTLVFFVCITSALCHDDFKGISPVENAKMSSSNVVLVRFQTKKQVDIIVSDLVQAGYQAQSVGINGSVAVWNGDDVVFTATRMQNDRYFCRASGQYMVGLDLAMVV